MSDPAPVSNSAEVFYLIVDHENKLSGGIASVIMPWTGSIARVASSIATKECLGISESKLEVYVFSGEIVVDVIQRQEQIKEFFRNKPIREGEKRKLSVIKYSEENDVLVVRLPEPTEEKEKEKVGKLTAEEDQDIRDTAHELITAHRKYLSNVAEMSGWSVSQCSDVKIINGVIRNGLFSEEAGPHIESITLFSPILASLWYDCSLVEEHSRQISIYIKKGRPDPPIRTHEDFLVSDELLGICRDFAEKSRYAYTSEQQRWSTVVEPYLNGILGNQDYSTEVFSNDKQYPKVDATWKTGHGPYVVVEVRNENGIGGNASLQGAYWYAKWLSKFKTRSFMHPIIIIAVAGNVLEISAAVLLDKVVMDPIVRLDMLGGFDFNQAVHKVAVISVALMKCVEALRKEHEEILNGAKQYSENDEKRFLPCPSKLPGTDLPDLDLVFTSRINRDNELVEVNDMEAPTKLFLVDYTSATEHGKKETKQVLVKFAATYGENAHRILADKGYAPELYACQKVIGKEMMIVMERLGGKPLSSCLEDGVPDTVFDDIESAMNILHDHGLVFGDLRAPNVIVVSNEGRESANLVDFDWAGIEGQVKYPPTLNKRLTSGSNPQFSEEVIACGLIQKEHDRFALRFLRELYRKKKKRNA